MPIYDYSCPRDGHFEVVKTMSEATNAEHCPQCGDIGQRIFTKFYFSGAAVQNAEWNPAFGCVVNNKYHRSELAKRNNMVEVGNDFHKPDNVHKTMDAQREEKRKRSWEKV